MDTVISILCDNFVSKPGFIGEHGFGLLIERGNEKYLFDTGPGMSLPINLKALDKNLDSLNKVFISHGHYDHIGGLKWVVQQVGKVEVVAHPAIFSKHMLLDPEDTSDAPRYIGSPYTQNELEQLGAILDFTSHTVEVNSGIWFVTGVDPVPGKRPNDARLRQPQGKQFVSDPMIDDASLLLETDSSPILILGCAHLGVLNILDHVREKMGIMKLRGILGGTHLMFYSPEKISRVMEEFEKFSVDLIAVSHCTGFQAAIELAKHFGDRFFVASAGSVFEF